MFFQCESVKWYPSHDDVIAVTNVLSKMDDEKYGMIIVGEDQNDIEHIGSTDNFDLYVVTTISEPCADIVDNKMFLAQNSNVTDILVGE